MNKSEYYHQLNQKIMSRKAIIGVVGIGYVGSTLAKATAWCGFQTIGFDINHNKVKIYNQIKTRKLSATHDFKRLSTCDIICVCVPTPVYQNKKADLRLVVSALKMIAQYLKPGQLVIVESTIGVGHTRSVILPLLTKSRLIAEKDFFLSYSPERIDPGNKIYNINNIPKIVSGIGKLSLNLTKNFYHIFIQRVIPVSTVEAAEMTKLLENTFRFINISFINELSNYILARGLNISEIISAASSKPYGFLAHYPGPGIGGHCIPVDPYYLTQDAQRHGHQLSLVNAASKINQQRPIHIFKKAVQILQMSTQLNKEYKVLLVGVAYKPNVSDTRESPALAIWKLLNKKGIKVYYHDPYITNINGESSVSLNTQILKKMDLIIIITDHSNIDYQEILNHQKPIFDTRNVFNGRSFSFLHRI